MSKKLYFEVRTVFEVDVPDDFPCSNEHVETIFDWKMNDHTDGRMAFSSEIALDGLMRAVRNNFCESVSQHIFKMPSFAKSNTVMQVLRARDRYEAKITDQISVRACGAGKFYFKFLDAEPQ